LSTYRYYDGEFIMAGLDTFLKDIGQAIRSRDRAAITGFIKDASEYFVDAFKNRVMPESCV
jgi:hypothetical protein